MHEIDALIGQYTHEQHRPRADVALQMLRKIASMVKPIMRQRGWRVGKLSEFYPGDQNLLGVNYNKGQRICLRLRYPSDHSLFLPIEQIIDTMLHELAHNIFGPHDEKFHKLWNDLRDEYEALIRKGYTGEGFLSNGQRLGGRGAQPITEARRLARIAAQNRQRQSGIGPQRVGGSAPSDRVDIRKTIADAAQRRRDILKGCGSTNTNAEVQDRILQETKRNEFETDGEIDDADMRAIEQAFMEMVQEDEEQEARSRAGASSLGSSSLLDVMPPPPVPTSSKPATRDSTPTDPPPRTELNTSVDTQSPSGDTWICQICTLENPEDFLCCDACSVERPSDRSAADFATPQRRETARTNTTGPPGDHKVLRSRSSAANIARFAEAELQTAQSRPVGWSCHQCGNFMESQWWTCAQCGAMKLKS